MLLSVSVWAIVAPLLAVQYIFAVTGLVFLYRRQMPKWQYVLWNVCILLVFFVGTAAFFIYNAACPQRGDAGQTDDGTKENPQEQSDGNG